MKPRLALALSVLITTSIFAQTDSQSPKPKSGRKSSSAAPVSKQLEGMKDAISAQQQQIMQLQQQVQNRDQAIHAPQQQVFHKINWSTVLARSESVTKILAILAGGVWAYFHYYRSRQYYPRLVPEPVGKIVHLQGKNYLHIVLKLKNCGFSRALIDHDKSWLRIYACNPDPNPSVIDDVDLALLATFGVFKLHNWIESGEEIEDVRLILLTDPSQAAFRLELNVFAQSSWCAETIALEDKDAGAVAVEI